MQCLYYYGISKQGCMGGLAVMATFQNHCLIVFCNTGIIVALYYQVTQRSHVEAVILKTMKLTNSLHLTHHHHHLHRR